MPDFLDELVHIKLFRYVVAKLFYMDKINE